MRWLPFPQSAIIRLMRRNALLLIAIVFSMLPLAAASQAGGIPVREGLFHSEEELGNTDFSPALTDEEREYYEDCHIYIVTASPTEPVYAYFGHAGIEVEAPGMPAVMFDYGTFTFDESFYMNFALGRLYYRLFETYADYRYADFLYADRTVRRLELQLSPERKKAVIGFLAYNGLPENNTYLYNYYKDNCATRIRDIYNATTDGAFREWAASIDTGRSFREWSTPCMAPSFFFAFILNYLQGPMVDKDIDLYDAAFLPDVLLSAIEGYEGRDSELVHRTETRPDVPESYSVALRSIPLSAAFAAVILLSLSKRRWIRRISDAAAGLAWLFLGLLSSVLLFMMAATNHDVTYWNQNALLISPAVIALAILHCASLGRTERRRAIGRLSFIFLAIAAVLLFLSLIGVIRQDSIAYFIVSISGYAAECISARYACRPFRPQPRQGARDR